MNKKKKIKGLLYWIVLLFSLLFLLSLATESTALVIKGIVRDKSTGSPITGASVTICGKSTKTDKHGAYKIEPKCKGEALNTLVSATGYYPWSETLTPEKKKEIAKDFELVPKVPPKEATPTPPPTIPLPPTVPITPLPTVKAPEPAPKPSEKEKPREIVIVVSPPEAKVTTGGRQPFVAAVANTPNTAVTWSVNDIPGGNPIFGTISEEGLYTAPFQVPSPSTVTIKATSVADPTKSATAKVTITEAISIKVNPSIANVGTSEKQQFTALVTNTPNTVVSWSVNDIPGGSSTFGTISEDGLYTAPDSVPSPPTVAIKAISQADSTKSAMAIVVITSKVSVSINPTKVAIESDKTQQFIATVKGTNNRAITWSIQDRKGRNITWGGVIAKEGLYTAPHRPYPGEPVITIKATSQADPQVSAKAEVTIGSRYSEASAKISISNQNPTPGEKVLVTIDVDRGKSIINPLTIDLFLDSPSIPTYDLPATASCKPTDSNDCSSFTYSFIVDGNFMGSQGKGIYNLWVWLDRGNLQDASLVYGPLRVQVLP